MSRHAPLLAAAALAALGATPSAAQSPLPLQTKAFLQTAAESDLFEIQEGRTAVVQSHEPRVRAFAEEMISDHTRTTEALKAAALRSGLPPPPPSLSGDQQKMLGALQSESGPDFDRAYARQQVLAHTQALVVEQGYASAGGDPNVAEAARSAVPVIQHHLQMAQRLHAALGDH